MIYTYRSAVLEKCASSCIELHDYIAIQMPLAEGITLICEFHLKKAALPITPGGELADGRVLR